MAMGRPRAFDVDEALDKALIVFWKKGYDGASLSELTEAMGIRPPSLYAAFGNKEGLFRRALDRYEEQQGCFIEEALAAPTAREAVEDDIRKRLERAKREGDLPKTASPAALARYVTTVLRGMSVQAAGGATAKELKQVAEMAMKVWPE